MDLHAGCHSHEGVSPWSLPPSSPGRGSGLNIELDVSGRQREAMIKKPVALGLDGFPEKASCIFLNMEGSGSPAGGEAQAAAGDPAACKLELRYRPLQVDLCPSRRPLCSQCLHVHAAGKTSPLQSPLTLMREKEALPVSMESAWTCDVCDVFCAACKAGLCGPPHLFLKSVPMGKMVMHSTN